MQPCSREGLEQVGRRCPGGVQGWVGGTWIAVGLPGTWLTLPPGMWIPMSPGTKLPLSSGIWMLMSQGRGCLCPQGQPDTSLHSKALHSTGHGPIEASGGLSRGACTEPASPGRAPAGMQELTLQKQRARRGDAAVREQEAVNCIFTE